MSPEQMSTEYLNCVFEPFVALGAPSKRVGGRILNGVSRHVWSIGHLMCSQKYHSCARKIEVLHMVTQCKYHAAKNAYTVWRCWRV